MIKQNTFVKCFPVFSLLNRAGGLAGGKTKKGSLLVGCSWMRSS